MTHRFPLVLAALLALAVPGVGISAPEDAPGADLRRERMNRMQERRGDPTRNEERFLDGLAMKDAERHRKVIEIRTSRPVMYRQLLQQSGQELRLRNRDPDSWDRLGRLIDQTYTLKGQLDAWDAADDKARKKLRPQVEQTVGRLFELRQEQRRAQLAVMEARLEKLRTEISARDARKDEVVREFSDRMLDALDEAGR